MVDSFLSTRPRLNVTPAQFAIAWLRHQENVVVIPKSSRRDRIQETYTALDIALSEADLGALDQAFPPPVRSQPLEMP